MLSSKIWDKSRWKRGDPKPSAVRAAHVIIGCSAHPGSLRRIWERDRRLFYKHRKAMLFRQRVTPFYGGGNWWAIPYGMVVCESGGNYHFTYGAYSMLDPAWHEWGGQTAHAGEASEREQDLAAHHGWLLYGEGAWECKSDGSTSWP